MRHLPEGVLRRLLDEPLAVPDSARHHRDACGRCRARGGEIATDAALAVRLLSAPEVSCDGSLAWAQLQSRLAGPARLQRPAVRIPRRPVRRLVGTSIGTGAALTGGLAIAGVAAAATLTTVFAPTKVAPVPVSQSDLRALTSVMGVDPAQLMDGLPAAGSSQQLPFGTVHWTSAGNGQRVASVAAARAVTHLAYSPPSTLPSGVGSPAVIVAAPMATATISFGAGAGPGVSGSSLVVSGGPAMVVQYGSPSGSANLPTLAILTMRRPVATSTGATISQLEAFLLSRPGIPAGLAQEIRLLGNLRTVLPVPVPAKTAAGQVQIDGSPGVLITAASGAAAGVIWEGRDGIIHAVAGLLDRKDVLNVARQLG
jgi:hypothetical protein